MYIIYVNLYQNIYTKQNKYKKCRFFFIITILVIELGKRCVKFYYLFLFLTHFIVILIYTLLSYSNFYIS